MDHKTVSNSLLGVCCDKFVFVIKSIYFGLNWRDCVSGTVFPVTSLDQIKYKDVLVYYFTFLFETLKFSP